METEVWPYPLPVACLAVTIAPDQVLITHANSVAQGFAGHQHPVSKGSGTNAVFTRWPQYSGLGPPAGRDSQG